MPLGKTADDVLNDTDVNRCTLSDDAETITEPWVFAASHALTNFTVQPTNGRGIVFVGQRTETIDDTRGNEDVGHIVVDQRTGSQSVDFAAFSGFTGWSSGVRSFGQTFSTTNGGFFHGVSRLAEEYCICADPGNASTGQHRGFRMNIEGEVGIGRAPIAGTPLAVDSRADVWERENTAISIADLNLIKDRGAAGQSGDNIGRLNFQSKDSGAAFETFARLDALISDATDTSEDGQLDLYAMAAGTLTRLIRLLGPDVLMENLPTSDPGVSGALWVDVGAGRVVKQSV